MVRRLDYYSIVIFYEPILICGLFSKNYNIVVFREQLFATPKVSIKRNKKKQKETKRSRKKQKEANIIICNMCNDYYIIVIFITHLHSS